jgi:hypothetical protein
MNNQNNMGPDLVYEGLLRARLVLAKSYLVLDNLKEHETQLKRFESQFEEYTCQRRLGYDSILRLNEEYDAVKAMHLAGARVHELNIA